MDKNGLFRKDLRHSWHPYTQMSTLVTEPPMLIDRAEGLYLFDAEGNRYYDAISSWWCVVHGHGHPRIREAVSRQMERLDHVLFAGVTHEPAVRLASRLAAIAPEGLSRVFFSDNGSTAVEVALKMSLQCRRNLGREERTGFLCLDHGYHGDTTGCMSVSGVESFLRAFRPILFPARRVPAPYCYRCPVGKEYPGCGVSCVDALGDALREGGDTITAVILEPLLLGAGGMIVYPPEYLSRASALRGSTGCTSSSTKWRRVRENGDDVRLRAGRRLAGFPLPVEGIDGRHDADGRDAHHRGGVQLLSWGSGQREDVLSRPHVYGEPGWLRRRARLPRPVRGREARRPRGAPRAPVAEGVRELAGLPMVGDVRGIGTVAALELVRDKETKEPLPGTAPLFRELRHEGLRCGLFLRPLGNVVYLFLPQAVTGEALDDIMDRFRATLRTVLL